MVQGAEGETVAFLIGIIRLMPLDVCCLDRQYDCSQPHIESADGTGVVVSRQHPISELPIASKPRDRLGRPQAQPLRIPTGAVTGCWRENWPLDS